MGLHPTDGTLVSRRYSGRFTMKRKIIGIGIIAVLAAAILFGTIGSVMEVIEASAATQPATEGEYVARLATAEGENPALEALKYVCPFH